MMLFLVQRWLNPGEDEWLEGVFEEDREGALKRLKEQRAQNKWDLDHVKCAHDYHFRIDVYEGCREIECEEDEDDIQNRFTVNWRDKVYSLPWEPVEVIE